MNSKLFYDQLSEVLDDLPSGNVCQFYLNSHGEIFLVSGGTGNWVLTKAGYLISFDSHLRVEDCNVGIVNFHSFIAIKESLGDSIPLWFSIDKISGIDKSRRDFLLSCYELFTWIKVRLG